MRFLFVGLLLVASPVWAGDTTGARVTCNSVGNEVIIDLEYSYLDIKDYKLSAAWGTLDGYITGYRYLTALWQRQSELKFSVTIEPDGTTNKLFIDFQSTEVTVRPTGKLFYQGNVTVYDRDAKTTDTFEGSCSFADGGYEG